jgi:hypothetical protein
MGEYSYQSIVVSQRRNVVEYLITRSRSKAASLWAALSLLGSDHHTRSKFPQIKPRSGREMRNQKAKARKFSTFRAVEWEEGEPLALLGDELLITSSPASLLVPSSDVTGLVGYKFDLCNQPITHLKLRTGSTR